MKTDLSYFVYSLIVVNPIFSCEISFEKPGVSGNNVCGLFFFLVVENGEHCDFTILRNMLIR